MNNKKIAAMFYAIADILEYKKVEWKPRAYRRAAQTLETLQDDVEDLYKKSGIKGLMELPGIGQDLGKKIVEFIETGKIHHYEELKKEFPVDFETLTSIPGLGPKRIIKLYNTLKIKNMEGLKRAVQKHKIKELEGFGEKSEQDIAKGIEMKEKIKGRLLLGETLPIAEKIAERIRAVKGVKNVEVVGSVRRMKETCGDIDILVVAEAPGIVMDAFVNMPEVAEVKAKGDTKTMVFLDAGLDCDIGVFKENEFGAAMMYFTGSKAHNIKLRKIAIDKKYKLNEYGLYDNKTNKKVAGLTEEEVYKKLGLKQWIPPEIREDEGEIELAVKGRLPKLIGYDEIKGDLQMHTDWSDGANTVKEMARGAKQMGYEYICISDHSRAGLAVAQGLETKADFKKQREEIEKADIKGLKIYHGIEANILPNGKIDVPDSILSELDIVLAGIHSRFKMSREEMTKRIVQAMKNEYVDIIVHPTGRIIGGRDPYSVDVNMLFDAAVETDTILEINAFPNRLDLSAQHVRAAKERGVSFAISTDSHSTEHLRYMRYGIGTARRGWAEKKDIINALPMKDFDKWVKKK